MQRSLQREIEELERITSTEPLTAEDLQTEAAQLRVDWDRWTQLLAAADGAHDEESFVSRIQPPTVPHRRKAPFAWIALAASLLVSSLALATWMGVRQLYGPATGAELRIASADNVTSGSATMPAGNSVFPDDGDLAWNDTLDERLDNLRSAVAGLHDFARRRDVHFSVLESRLNEVFDEIDSDSL